MNSTLKTYLLITLISFLLIKPCFSQTNHSITLGPDLGIPTTSFGKAKLGFGGSLFYNWKFSNKIDAHINTGVIGFTNKFNSTDRVQFVPVRAGLTFNLYQDIFSLLVSGGISHYSSKSTKTKQDGATLGTGFIVTQHLSGKQILQFSALYNVHHFERKGSGQSYNYNWFTLRVGYGLAWGRQTQN